MVWSEQVPLACSLVIVDSIASVIAPVLGSGELASGHALLTATGDNLLRLATLYGKAVLVCTKYTLSTQQAQTSLLGSW